MEPPKDLVDRARLDAKMLGCTCTPDITLKPRPGMPNHWTGVVVHFGGCPLNTDGDVVTGPHMVVARDA